MERVRDIRDTVKWGRTVCLCTQQDSNSVTNAFAERHATCFGVNLLLYLIA